MKLPTIHGYIDRRMLLNFVADRMLFEELFLNRSGQSFIKTEPSLASASSGSFQHIGILSLEFHVDKLSRPLL